MFTIIERLQQKSVEERRVIALGVSGGVTFLIGLIWLSSLTLSDSQGGETQQAAVTGAPSPLSTLKSGFASVFADFNRGSEEAPTAAEAGSQ